MMVSGAIVGDSFKTDGNEFVVSTAGLVTATGLNNAGAPISSSAVLNQVGTAYFTSVVNITGAANIVGLASLDGGIDVNSSNFSVGTDGAVVAASLNNSNGGITNAGAIAGATTISGSGRLSVGGDIVTEFIASAAAADLQLGDAGLIVYDESNTKLVKAHWTDLVSGSAGSGISFNTTTGKFSIDTQTVTVIEEGTATVLLSEGINAFTGALGRNRTLQLPAPATCEAGDTITIKLNSFSSGVTKVIVTGSSLTGTLDGELSIDLESPYGSVDLVRLNTTGDWMIK